MVTVIYKHWKKEQILEVSGEVVHNNPSSDRIVVKTNDGKYEDVLKNTIVEIVDDGD